MAEAQEPQVDTPQPRHAGKAKWYIVHAYSNFEAKVAEAIREQAGRQGLEEQFEDIQVPTEEVTEVVRGAKKVRQHRHFPGYVLVKMEMTDEAYHLVKNTPKVTGFLGTQNKPQPVSDREVERILGPGRGSRRRQAAQSHPLRNRRARARVGRAVPELRRPCVRGR
jgi:transcription termination/antitermination protein NusG